MGLDLGAVPVTVSVLAASIGAVGGSASGFDLRSWVRQVRGTSDGVFADAAIRAGGGITTLRGFSGP